MRKDFVIGIHPVINAIKEGIEFKQLLIARNKKLPFIEEFLQKNKDKRSLVVYKNLSEIERLFPNSQGIVMFIKRFEYADEEETVLNVIKSKKVLLAFSGIMDVRNIGAVARTAQASGLVGGIILPKHRSLDITPAAIKASTGSLLSIPVVRLSNLRYFVKDLKRRGVSVIGVEKRGSVRYDMLKYDLPICCVFGSESKSLSDVFLRDLDQNVYIPMSNDFNSLNLSVASSILLYEIFRQKNFEL
ncbi:RNA methyltransferase, TrmH family, group 3 [Thermodesulfobium narugense DSM 14796]|uniref:RNA methyltransferase, TrmH family, group 3 n=1 Tax=Thermodesulfobium narugense DSM 14796 TaxID=747365 RepID=M1E5N3_9BACT|nr:RNA methyltransferase [Thermodesulfobium narugense]AEE14371.1 RNA methyltransferase, TrmH family, group 3 [Thermodesulfobium narugense DSM 14796]